MIAKIAVSAVPFSADKPYSYRFGEEMNVCPGMRVTVPFGRGNRPSEGIVLAVESGDEAKLKTIAQTLDEHPILNDRMLRLAAFLRERYFCTFYEAARAMLPAGLWFRQVERFALSPDAPWQESKTVTDDQRAICGLLAELGGTADGSALKKAVPEDNTRQDAIKALLKRKWITRETDFLPRTGEKSEKIASLAVPADQALAFAARRGKSAAMQKAVLELLAQVGSCAVKELCYYTGASTATLRRLAELGMVELSQRQVLRCREIKPEKLDGPLTLNIEQQRVFRGLAEQMDSGKPGAALLWGVTGSGKTSVYLKLIDRCLARGKSAMLLVPEIALTPQLLSLLAAYFGDQVAVLHSSLSDGERYDQWNRLRSGEAKVAVGTRSAVFAPCEHLGLIVLDEEQEHSYKSENAPRYSAKEVALWRGAKENALVLYGSATPSVETMYRAKTGVFQLYKLENRYNGKELPRVEIVDLREEVKKGNDLPFSEFLLDSIRDNLEQKKQTILFLNRRGASRALVCVDCRESPECPRCSNRLTYHSANRRLMCHYCGFSQNAVERCPACGGPLKAVGVGTQRIQEVLEFEFPDTEVLRMDADTVNAVNTHEKILERFQREKVPILIGTQMVAKGLNLPDVTLVGVLDADMSLYSDSFRAGETTFDMLTQVVGRAGRGDDPGRAVIQTMAPEHRIIRLAAAQDYEGFYELEIGLRRVMGSPPFADLVTIAFSGEDEAAVIRGATVFRDSLNGWLSKTPDIPYNLLGPAPCPVMKINYNFRYRLTLRCRADQALRANLAYFLRQFLGDKANRGVSAFVDINGYE